MAKVIRLTPEQAQYAKKFIAYTNELLGLKLSAIGNDDRESILISIKLLLGTAIKKGILNRYESLEVRENRDVSVLIHFSQGMSIWMDLIHGQ